MNLPDDSGSDAAAAAPPLPNQTVRTLISLALFVHLFGVLMVVFSNPPSSQLQRQLRNVPGLIHYLHPLFLDNGYRYALTQGSELDMANWLEVALRRDGQALGTVTFPEDAYQPRIRFNRYLNLMDTMQRLVRIAEIDARSQEVQGGRDLLLPQAVTVGLMREAGADSARLQLRGRALQTMDALESTSQEVRDPLSRTYLHTVLIADVAIDPEGNVTFVRQELEERRTAPPPAQQAP